MPLETKVFCILLAALVTPISLLNAQKDSNLPPLETVNGLLLRYLKANGGELSIQRVASLRLQGDYTSENATVPFLQVKRTPDYVRNRVRLPEGTLDSGYNGEVAWIKTDGMRQAIPMPESRAANYITNASIYSQLYRQRKDESNISYEGITKVRDKPAYELRVVTEEGFEVAIFLDAETFFESKLQMTSEANGNTLLYETYFSDIRYVRPLYIPHFVENYVNGEWISSVRIDRVAINQGVLPTFFNPPGGMATVETLPPEKEEATTPEETFSETKQSTVEIESILDSGEIKFVPEDVAGFKIPDAFKPSHENENNN